MGQPRGMTCGTTLHDDTASASNTGYPHSSEDLNGLEMAKEFASEALDFPSTGQREKRSLTFWRITAAALTFSSFLLWTWPWISQRISTRFVTGPDSDVPDIGVPESLLRSWAQYSPYIPVAKYTPPPPGCVVSQVSSINHFLQTHS
jgi:hypothetical protein